LEVRSVCEAERSAARKSRIFIIQGLACRAVERGCKQAIGLEPAFLRPGRARPAVKRHAGVREQNVDRNLLERYVGVIAGELPSGAYDRLGKLTPGTDLFGRCQHRRLADRIHDRVDTIEMMQVVGGVRRHRIGMENETAALFLAQRGHETARGATAGVRRRKTRRGGLERERSEEHTSELQSRQYLVCRL